MPRDTAFLLHSGLPRMPKHPKTDIHSTDYPPQPEGSSVTFDADWLGYRATDKPSLRPNTRIWHCPFGASRFLPRLKAGVSMGVFR
jgi:hypothetical protein